MTTILITWTDKSHAEMIVTGYSLEMTGLVFHESENEWTFIPFANVKSLDFVERNEDDPDLPGA